MKIIFVSVFIFLCSQSEARVFDFSKQTLSTYLRATGGPTGFQRSAYGPEFPPTVTFSDANAATMNYSAEIGLAFTSPTFYSLRLGVEALYPTSTGASNGITGGVSQFSVSSLAYSIIPQGNIEIYIKKKPSFRPYVGFGAGIAYTSFKNTVTMTPQGQATLGVGSYTEQATGTGLMGQGYLGFEFPAFDNVGMSFDLGYRYLKVASLTANSDYQNANGIYHTGDTIKNADGSTRTLDLSGLFAALNFRFYFN